MNSLGYRYSCVGLLLLSNPTPTNIINIKVMFGCFSLNLAKTVGQIWIKLGTPTFYNQDTQDTLFWYGMVPQDNARMYSQ